nr:Hint domain-containing protein [Maritimibacter sp. DP1N21-5]
MVGISITTGYSTQVVGVAFDGAAPPSGTTLYYLQGQSSYGGTGQTVTNPTTVPCFLAGTLIDTPKGPVPAERLAAGDRVFTLDSGAKKLRWVGRSVVDGTGSCAPIRIRAGVLGNRRDLFVSPNHRVLIEAWVAELHFGQRQVLVPAKALVDGVNVLEVPMAQADYVHLLLPRHELVFSEGVASESLFVSEMGLGAFGPEARADLSAVITRRDLISQKLARTALTVAEARAMQVFARSRKTRTGRPFMALAS